MKHSKVWYRFGLCGLVVLVAGAGGCHTTELERTSTRHEVVHEQTLCNGDKVRTTTETSVMAPVVGDNLAMDTAMKPVTAALLVSGVGVAPWFNKFRSNYTTIVGSDSPK